MITALLPISFLFTGGPAGWLVLVTAGIGDIRKNIWAWPALFLIGAEMFGKEALRYLAGPYGQSAVGYLMISLLMVHIGFASRAWPSA
ncbi:MAG TPA: hypothetical protein VGI79_18285 [Caulobacteraceae bacterium]